MSHSRYSLRPILAIAGLTLVTACQDDEAGPTAVNEPTLAQTQATYTVKALVIPGNALLGEASDINDAGVIAGWYQVGNTWSAARCLPAE